MIERDLLDGSRAPTASPTAAPTTVAPTSTPTSTIAPTARNETNISGAALASASVFAALLALFLWFWATKSLIIQNINLIDVPHLFVTPIHSGLLSSNCTAATG